nr:unnamed protein product [Digitaria exilis]
MMGLAEARSSGQGIFDSGRGKACRSCCRHSNCCSACEAGMEGVEAVELRFSALGFFPAGAFSAAGSSYAGFFAAGFFSALGAIGAAAAAAVLWESGRLRTTRIADADGPQNQNIEAESDTGRVTARPKYLASLCPASRPKSPTQPHATTEFNHEEIRRVLAEIHEEHDPIPKMERTERPVEHGGGGDLVYDGDTREEYGCATNDDASHEDATDVDAHDEDPTDDGSTDEDDDGYTDEGEDGSTNEYPSDADWNEDSRRLLPYCGRCYPFPDPEQPHCAAVAKHSLDVKMSAFTGSFDDEVVLWTFKAGVGVLVAPDHGMYDFAQFVVKVPAISVDMERQKSQG